MSHLAVLTSIVKYVHRAAGWRIQTCDTTDLWHDQWNTVQFVPLRDISLDSIATRYRCGKIFSEGMIANFFLFLTVNNFENLLIFDKVKAYKKLCQFFGPPCIYTAVSHLHESLCECTMHKLRQLIITKMRIISIFKTRNTFYLPIHVFTATVTKDANRHLLT